MKGIKFIGAALLSISFSTGAIADGVFCSDVSFNDPSCSAYLQRSDAVKVSAVSSSSSKSNGPACSDVSFQDANCPAYIKPSNKVADLGGHSAPVSAVCSDVSFNDPDCPAYLKR